MHAHKHTHTHAYNRDIKEKEGEFRTGAKESLNFFSEKERNKHVEM